MNIIFDDRRTDGPPCLNIPQLVVVVFPEFRALKRFLLHLGKVNSRLCSSQLCLYTPHGVQLDDRLTN